jgi:hypothetical protein
MGNFAFPDFYSVYFITFLSPNQYIKYYNEDKNKNYIIISITFYDNCGKIIEYYDEYIGKISKKNGYRTKNYTVAIIRIYSKYPKITLEHIIIDQQINFDTVFNNTKRLTYYYKKLISFKQINLDITTQGFRFSKENLSLYFTNYRARYLICTIPNDIVIITAKKPKCDESLLYFAFILCNLKSTETNDCINCDELQNKYTIFVSRSYYVAKQYGYNETLKSHKLLLWSQSLNKSPIIIYREIRTDNSGLFSIPNGIASQEAIKCVMGEYYPQVRYE